MVKIKVTFTLDEETVFCLQKTAERLNRAKSQVVREAIHDYGKRAGRLSETERLKMLRIFDELVPGIPERPHSEVERELRAIRQARQGGGRRTPAKS